MSKHVQMSTEWNEQYRAKIIADLAADAYATVRRQHPGLFPHLPEVERDFWKRVAVWVVHQVNARAMFRRWGAMGGKSVTGAKKRRTHEQCVKAGKAGAMARWGAVRATHALPASR